MCKRLENEPYPFCWLDEVIEITLNPEKTNNETLTVTALEEIKTRLTKELANIHRCIKTQVFYLYRNDKVKVIAGHYDQAIRLLQSQAQSNLSQYPKSGPLRQTGELLLNGLNELSKNVRKRYSGYLPEPPPDNPEMPGSVVSQLTKFLCMLSTDQIGIIIRAACEVKLIIGQSFSKVCKAIAPYLSTQRTEQVSGDSIRSHAGRPERHDKEVAIAFLEKMIDRIRGYR